MRQYDVRYLDVEGTHAFAAEVEASTDVQAIIAANVVWDTEVQVGEVYDVTPLPNGTTRRVEVTWGLREVALGLPGEDTLVNVGTCQV